MTLANKHERGWSLIYLPSPRRSNPAPARWRSTTPDLGLGNWEEPLGLRGFRAFITQEFTVKLRR